MLSAKLVAGFMVTVGRKVVRVLLPVDEGKRLEIGFLLAVNEERVKEWVVERLAELLKLPPTDKHALSQALQRATLMVEWRCRKCSECEHYLEGCDGCPEGCPICSEEFKLCEIPVLTLLVFSPIQGDLLSELTPQWFKLEGRGPVAVFVQTERWASSYVILRVIELYFKNVDDLVEWLKSL